MGWHDHRGYCNFGKNNNDNKEIPIDKLPDFHRMEINHSRRVYNIGDFIDNHVARGDLKDHIWYNKTMRFGTALFINGVCVHRGYLGKARCEKIEKEIQEMLVKEDILRRIQYKFPTVPYR